MLMGMMMDVNQNELLKEYVDSAAGYETTPDEAKEFIEGLLDSQPSFIDDLKLM
jgi:hypothetical protein